ncbi:MAG: biotin--[acetyl-CoA-carboxylase] ligase [Verrucomicrobiia bacterium]
MTDALDVLLLRHLFADGRPFVCGASLASALGCSRREVNQRVEALGEVGYRIEARPHAGYRLVEAGDVLVADEVRARLEGNVFAQRLVVFRETRSTNDVVLREAERGAPHGFAVLAESQTAGRGRLGRAWMSAPACGLWFSVLFRPGGEGGWQTPQGLTMLAAVAVARAVDRQVARAVSIKWPNDLLFEGKKVCGILVEARVDGERRPYGVVGIGLNVNHRSTEFPEELRGRAVSLRMVDGVERRRADVLVSVFEELARLEREGMEAVASAWRERCETIGTLIQVQTADGVREGVMTGVTEEGHLMLRGASGAVEIVVAGTVLSLGGEG